MSSTLISPPMLYFINMYILLILHAVYTAITIYVFGIPKSLSETYYLYNSKCKYLGLIFPCLLFTAICFLLPSFLMIGKLEFLIFIAIGSLLFTTITPAFKTNSIVNNTHTISAWICAICSLLWMLLVFPVGWKILLLSAIIWAFVFILFGKLSEFKNTYTFWLENIVFTSLYLVLLLGR